MQKLPLTTAFLLTIGLFSPMLLSCQVAEYGLIAGPAANPTNQAIVLFQDNFSDPQSGWDRIADGSGISQYTTGAYEIRVLRDDWYIWSNPGLNFTDVRVEVDVIKTSPEPIGIVGIICRYQDPDNFYFVSITSDGFFGINKFISGEETLIGMEEFKRASTISLGASSNHLRFDCIEDTLSVYVNGHLLAEVQDQDLQDGDVGVIVGTLDGAHVGFQFDNFAVLKP